MKESNIIHEINMDNIKNEEALVGLLNYMDGDIAIADDIRDHTTEYADYYHVYQR